MGASLEEDKFFTPVDEYRFSRKKKSGWIEIDNDKGEQRHNSYHMLHAPFGPRAVHVISFHYNLTTTAQGGLSSCPFCTEIQRG